MESRTPVIGARKRDRTPGGGSRGRGALVGGVRGTGLLWAYLVQVGYTHERGGAVWAGGSFLTI